MRPDAEAPRPPDIFQGNNSMLTPQGRASARAFVLFGLSLLLPMGSALAQEIEGMQTMQIIPVVVDSTTFKSRIDLFNAFGVDTTLDVTYVPGDGTTQAANGVLACQQVTVPALQPLTIVSIRDICPTLAAGSQFGYLKLVRANVHGSSQKFHQLGVHAFSRVSNYQGQGFSVEAFPLHTFAWNRQVVSGVRRLAPTANSPGYQTNCFVGTLDDNVGGEVSIKLATAADAPLGNEIKVLTGPSRLIRLLDVFSAAGLASGDYDDVKVTFSSGLPTAFGFCTVQDNTSFGADFRIGKQVYPREMNEQRVVVASSDLLGRKLSLPEMQADYYQLLAMEFHHPDLINCIVYGSGAVPPAPPPSVPSNVELSLWIKDPQQHALRQVSDNGQYRYVSELADTKMAINDGVDTTLYALIARTGGGATTDYTLQCLSGSGLSVPVIVDEAPMPFLAPNLP